ncbi:MAG: Ldh family oxidoreductase [Candidatus Dormiibacterota bacterium]
MGEEVLVAADTVQVYLDAILRNLGADPDVAAEASEHLVGANLAGHDSHGIMRIVQYVDNADRGALQAAHRGSILKEGPSLALFDAERGLGQWSSRQALDWCTDHAKGAGIAAAAVRHSTHVGRLGHYAEIAAQRGFVSIVSVGLAGPGAGVVAPFGGAGRFLGTNPWAFGVPADGRTPMIADFATSQVAEGKVRLARYKGQQLPLGLIVDAGGEPTSDPTRLYDGGALLGIGGGLTGHKGYGLGLAAALFGGLATIGDEQPTTAGTMAGRPPAQPWLAGFFVAVLDPEWFGGLAPYQAQVHALLDTAAQVPPAPGTDRVLVPGEPEALRRAERRRDGLAIPAALWEQLEQLGARFQIPLPAPLA